MDADQSGLGKDSGRCKGLELAEHDPDGGNVEGGFGDSRYPGPSRRSAASRVPASRRTPMSEPPVTGRGDRTVPGPATRSRTGTPLERPVAAAGHRHRLSPALTALLIGGGAGYGGARLAERSDRADPPGATTTTQSGRRRPDG